MTRPRTVTVRTLTTFTLFVAAFYHLIAAAASAQQGDFASASGKSLTASGPVNQPGILDSYGKLPLSFEENQGQADARVKFLSRASGYSLFLTADGAVFALGGSKPETNEGKTAEAHISQSSKARPAAGAVVRMRLCNVNRSATVTGVNELAGRSNYFFGNDPAKWRTNIPTYAKVKYEGIYPGIDLVYYGNQRQLEYDFIVAPGASPYRIEFEVSGAKRIRRDGNGDLVLRIHGGEVHWQKPVVYQEKEGARQEIAARYTILTPHRVAFELAQYDKTRPLYIDPLIYSTYLGSGIYPYFNLTASSLGIAVDGAGNAYVTGPTDSDTFPITPGAFQTTCCGAFVTKINPTGSGLVYSTYLSADAFAIAVDSTGDAYVTGMAGSGLPTTPGAFQTTCAGTNGCAFVTKLNPTGSALVYSTLLGAGGGSRGDRGSSIAVDSGGSAYITGFATSTNFPVTPGAFQPTCIPLDGACGDAFAAKFSPAGSTLIYSTYLGGTSASFYPSTVGYGIAIDAVGNAFVAGETSTNDFPTTLGAYQTTCTTAGNPPQCNNNGFVTKLNPEGSAPVYSTYLGVAGDFTNYGIAVDAGGNAYVTGGGPFVIKLNPAGSAPVYANYIACCATGIAVDRFGDAWVTGGTNSNSFPTTPNAFQRVCNEGGTSCNYGAGFLSKLDPSGTTLVYSTYLGGTKGGGSMGFAVAVDREGNAYALGSTFSTNFPVTPGAFQQTYGGSSSVGDASAFVAKFYSATTTTAVSSSLNASTYGEAVTWTAAVNPLGSVAPTGTVTFSWDGYSIGTATLNSSGVATLTKSNLNAYTYPLTAAYSGDGNNAGSTSAVLSQVVKQTTSAAKLTSSPNPSTQGQSVTFSATITSPTVTPTGPVTFTAGTTVLGTAQLSGGKATFTTSTLPVGSTTVTVTYPWNSNISGSSASVVQVVE